MDQHRAAGCVVRHDSNFVDEVDAPDDVGIARGHFQGRVAVPGHVRPFLGERPVIAIGHTLDVQTDNFCRRGHQVDPIPIHGRRRTDADLLLHEMRIDGQVVLSLGHHQLPQEFALLFAQTLDHAGMLLTKARIVREPLPCRYPQRPARPPL